MHSLLNIDWRQCIIDALFNQHRRDIKAMQMKRLSNALLITVFLGTFTHAAYAGYTVIDDDLFPTSTIAPVRVEQRRVEVARVEPSSISSRVGGEQHYAVPFSKYQNQLTPAGRAKLDKLLPEMEGARIRIVGRADASTPTGSKTESLPYSRANMIRTYLMRKGISAADITLQIDESPNPQPNGTIYPSDIYISRADRSPAPIIETIAYPSQPKYQPMAAQQIPATSNSATPSNNDARTIQYINQAVQDGQMSAAVAVKLIQFLVESKSSTAAPIRAAAIQPVAIIQPVTAVLPPVQIQPQAPTPTWTLDQKLTLRENIDAWSKIAGWNPGQWEASNFFQVTATSTVEGNFPDVLRQIADSTGLNICAKSREKVVRVTDASVSCK